MTVMTRAEAREETRREAVADLIPDHEARARVMMEDLSIPAEFEAYGFENTHDVANHIEDEVVETIRDAPVPADAGQFVEEEVEEARVRVYDLVMEEFEDYAEDRGLGL